MPRRSSSLRAVSICSWARAGRWSGVVVPPVTVMEVALVEETSVREVDGDDDGEGGGLVLFWARG